MSGPPPDSLGPLLVLSALFYVYNRGGSSYIKIYSSESGRTRNSSKTRLYDVPFKGLCYCIVVFR